MKARKARVVFLCLEHSCHSHLAEAFAKQYGQERIDVWSAGSHPRGAIDPMVAAVMREQELELFDQASKGFHALSDDVWDLLVTMGCEDGCPVLPAHHRLEWGIPDPKGQPIERYRQVRESHRRNGEDGPYAPF